MRVSIVVPCYNEEENIRPLVECFEPLAGQYDLELILVDNGSEDRTGAEIERHASQCFFVKKAFVQHNQGYGWGILTGLAAAEGDVLGWIHADLQSNPNVFHAMLSAAEAECSDFLYKGARKGRTILDTFFTWGMGAFESLYFGMRLWDINSQPTLVSRKFYESWSNPPQDFSLDLYVYALAKYQGLKIVRFDSLQQNRLHGASTWNVKWDSRMKMCLKVIRYSMDIKRKIKKKLR